jgi:hypothetical protein
MFPNKLTLGIAQNVMNFEKYEEILRIEILVCWFPMEEVRNLNHSTPTSAPSTGCLLLLSCG